MPTNPKADRNFRCRGTPPPRITVMVLLAATLILGLSDFTGATTINAKSASQSDVAAGIASAADGDTVTIPAGTANWTRTLEVKKGITIQGAGVGVTIIRDAVQSGQLISWQMAAGLPSRLTGIEFQDGGRLRTADAPGGILRVDGSNTDGSSFRWDHCKWNDLNGYAVFDTVLGVIDHNSFALTTGRFATYIYASRWNGQSYGDGSWAAPSNYGSSEFLFFEDNTFTSNDKVYNQSITDALAGGRFVVRHNTINNAYVDNHGTDSGGRIRGCRAVEVYNNTFNGGNSSNVVGASRSGGVIFHDNNISGYGSGGHYHLNNFRNFYPFSPWGGADGTNAWDVNEPTVFFTGTAAADSSGTTVAVSGANWTTNQWAGYTLRRTTDHCNSGSLSFGWILSNTSNTISYASNPGYPTPPATSFCAGDSLEIRKVDHALDQPGRARGSLITGDTPVRPQSRNDQVTEPCYSWNNTNENNGQVNFSEGPGVRSNVHYLNNTPLPGYTPYAYPHPLTKGLPLPARRTQNATASSQNDGHKKKRPWGGKEPERKQAKKAKESPTNVDN
jgi:hypothetical protein